METTPKIFIYGSCVSRDPLELTTKFCLVDYFARSSIGSAFRPVIQDWEPNDILETIASNFQRKAVESDIRKTLASTIKTAEFDCLVLDFVDERMSTIEFKGSTLTHSAELLSSGFEVDPAQSFEPWTEMGLRRRKEGIRNLTELCDPATIIVNRVFWATHNSAGEPFTYRRWIDRNNLLLADLYAEIARTPGVRFIDYPPEMLVADVNHKWGVQAYHFTEKVNQHFLDELGKMVSRLVPPHDQA